MELVFGIVLLVMAVFLIVAVLMQSGKEKLSSTLTGSAETFLGKSNATKKDKILSIATTTVAILFVITVVAMYIVVG